WLQLDKIERAVEYCRDGTLDELLDDLLFAAVLHRFEFDLAAERRDHVREVAHARHHRLLVVDDAAAHGIREQALVVRDARADADAGALVYVRAAPGQAADLRDHFLHVVRHDDMEVGGHRVVLRPEEHTSELPSSANLV